MLSKECYVYMIASGKYGTLYSGVTRDWLKRIYIHKEKLVDGFSKKYRVDKLVYFEIHNDIDRAILREKQIKKWNRDWKINLIERINPDWIDLYDELNGWIDFRLRGHDKVVGMTRGSMKMTCLD